ncbi:MAG: diacylglycerol kinase [Solirubrobacterales bacterium]|jgi:diacylglycerol kinase family enzyme|nr:diacylglycerol kinase [Solirubrobacterales bacterium]
MRSVALLKNPESGSGEADDVAECLRGHGLEVREFALDGVEDAVATTPDGLGVAGGDGSLASVAAAAAHAGLPLAIIPTGTANDLARKLEIPLDPEEACELAVHGTRTRRIDIGRMGDSPFLNLASCGLPPAAAEHAHGLKGTLGPLAYAVGGARAGVQADPVACTVRCDGEEIHAGEAWQVTVACSGAFGGGSSIETELADRQLDVVVIEAGSRLKLAQYAYGLRRGGIGEHEGVTHVRCSEATVELERPERWNLDGELIEAGTSEFRVDPNPVEVVVG